MESNLTWRNWFVRLALIRVGGAISAVLLTYWTTNNLSLKSGAGFVGNTTALANASEVLLAIMVGSSLVRTSGKWTRSIALVCAITAILLALNPQFELLWLMRIGDGVVAGLATTSALSTVLAHTKNDPKGARLIVSFESIVILAFAVGSLIAAVTWRNLGVYGYAIVGCIYLASTLVKVDVELDHKVESLSARARSLRNPIIGAVLAISTSASMWISQITFVLTGERVSGQLLPGSMNKTQVATLLMIYLIALSIGLGIWSQVLVRMKSSVAVLVGSGGAVFAPAFLLGTNVSALAPQLRTLSLGLYGVLLLVQTGLIPSILATLNNTESGKNPTALSSFIVITTATGSIAGPLIGGVAVANASFTGLCITSIGLAGIAFLSSLIGAHYSRERV